MRKHGVSVFGQARVSAGGGGGYQAAPGRNIAAATRVSSGQQLQTTSPGVYTGMPPAQKHRMEQVVDKYKSPGACLKFRPARLSVRCTRTHRHATHIEIGPTRPNSCPAATAARKTQRREGKAASETGAVCEGGGRCTQRSPRTGGGTHSRPLRTKAVCRTCPVQRPPLLAAGPLCACPCLCVPLHALRSGARPCASPNARDDGRHQPNDAAATLRGPQFSLRGGGSGTQKSKSLCIKIAPINVLL